MAALDALHASLAWLAVLDVLVLEPLSRPRVLELFDNLRRLVAVAINLRLLRNGFLLAVFDYCLLLD